jgi:hypothetical protein
MLAEVDYPELSRLVRYTPHEIHVYKVHAYEMHAQ